MPVLLGTENIDAHFGFAAGAVRTAVGGAVGKVVGAIGSAAGAKTLGVANKIVCWVVRNTVLYETVGAYYAFFYVAEYSCKGMVAAIATALAVGSAAIYVATPFVNAALHVSYPLIGGLRRIGALLSSVF